MPSTKSSSKPKPSEPVAGWQFEAIGTTWWIGFYHDPQNLERLKTAVLDRIEAYDKAFSRFRGDSLITKISQQAGTFRLPTEAEPLLNLYNKLFTLTDGAVTPLVGQLLSDAGYDATYSLKPRELHTPPAWDKTVHQHGTTITTTRPTLIDLGAAGKGHLIDIVADILAAHGITEYVIDAGGDILQHHASDALVVGLEHPDDISKVIGTYELHNQALCGSAGNRRAWGEYHHIMDPRSKRPVSTIKAVWVAAASAMLADGLSTALFFVPPSKLSQDFDFTYCIVDADNRVTYSPDFKGKLFT